MNGERAVGTLVYGNLIWIVGHLRLGMEVNGFSAAFLAGLIIAVGSVLAGWLWTLVGAAPRGGLASTIIH